MSDVSFVLIYVEDVARSVEFYARVLDKPVAESSPNFAMIPVAPGLMLGLWRRGEVAPKATAAPGASEIAVAVPDEPALEALHARWAATGAAVAQAPIRMDFGFTFVILDPDGHRLRAFVPAGP